MDDGSLTKRSKDGAVHTFWQRAMLPSVLVAPTER
jgi:hypothetical protein